jgi:hypothetical protein
MGVIENLEAVISVNCRNSRFELGVDEDAVLSLLAQKLSIIEDLHYNGC